MKRVITFFSLIAVSALCLLACFKDQLGFPKRITFPAEGGVITVQGDKSGQSIRIHEDVGKGAESQTYHRQEPFVVTYEWLTVQGIWGEASFEVKADKNETGRKRSLLIYYWIQNPFVEIEVVQSP